MVSLKIAFRILVRNLLHLFFVFPIHTNRILFSSYNHGIGYTCNPKYICEYLKRHCPGEYELIWAYAEPDKWKVDETRSIKMHSLSWLYYLLTSSVVIYNRNPESYLPKRPGQLIINTWHAGGAYKKVGFENATLGRLDMWRVQQFNRYVDLFISSSAAFTASNIEGYHYTGEVLKSGMPRNDLFFQPDTVCRIRKNVREQYGAKEDTFVILYAPTFRRNVMNPKARNVSFPYVSVLKALEPHPVQIWRREHQEDNNRYSAETTVTDVSAYPDMQELLCAADALITDYSSSIWDYALLGRPCFLYVPDLEDYLTADRGFFTPIETWPGVLCRSEDELTVSLTAFSRNEFPYRSEDFAGRAAAHLKELESYEDGHATERVAERIQDWKNRLSAQNRE